MEQLAGISPFQNCRLKYHPPLPAALIDMAYLKPIPAKIAPIYDHELVASFPYASKLSTVEFEKSSEVVPSKAFRVGVVFSGGQAPGGNNVIMGLYDALKALSPASALIGFLGGPSGLVEGRSKEISAELLSGYRNCGGFDLLGSDRTKLDASTRERVLKNVEALKLDGLVIIGGDDSNTNAALLAEYFLSKANKTRVVGVPKTIDGDLKSRDVEISFGFDTATKTYADIIGNLARDALSAKKYYFFVKLMGRTASSIALECALQTHPNYALIGEEIMAEGYTLTDIVNALAELVCERSKHSKEYGVILVPEGLLEFIPDCKLLIKELGVISQETPLEKIADHLSPRAKTCYLTLPEEIKKQLMLDRDPHGNLQVSKIETERLLIEMVAKELKKRKMAGRYQGTFNPQPLFCGYEGRSCAPSNFDANYCYALGHVAVALIQNGLTGYMAAVKGLSLPIESWQPLGVPLLALMGFEERKGVKKAVIRKALVDLNGQPFARFKTKRDFWALNDDYRYPGPIQYFGPPELTESITCTLALESVKLNEIAKEMNESSSP